MCSPPLISPWLLPVSSVPREPWPSPATSAATTTATSIPPPAILTLTSSHEVPAKQLFSWLMNDWGFAKLHQTFPNNLIFIFSQLRPSISLGRYISGRLTVSLFPWLPVASLGHVDWALPVSAAADWTHGCSVQIWSQLCSTLHTKIFNYDSDWEPGRIFMSAGCGCCNIIESECPLSDCSHSRLSHSTQLSSQNIEIASYCRSENKQGSRLHRTQH